MDNYSNIVLSIINNEGKEYAVESSIFDEKHFMAFKRLVDKMDDDCFNINKYIESKNSLSITGFDIAKYVSACGNIVFFHTDVHNAFWGRKEASIMLSESMTDQQRDKLRYLTYNLKGFNLHTGKTHFPKRKSTKVSYNRIPEKYVLEIISEYKENKVYGKKR